MPKDNEDAEGKSGSGCLYVKVSMDGAPYLRKVDLKTYSNYAELSSGLEKMFSCFTIGMLYTISLSLTLTYMKYAHAFTYTFATVMQIVPVKNILLMLV